MLAALIFCEAGGEPYEGQVAEGAVVMNRVRSGIFPNSITEVIYQSGQFGPAITGKLDAGTCRRADNGKLLSGSGRCPRRSQSDRGGTLFWKW